MLEGECRIWNLGVQVWRGDEAEKKKKKMFFSKNPTISEGEGGKLGALGEVIQAKKKKLYAGLLHDSEGALWDSRC